MKKFQIIGLLGLALLVFALVPTFGQRVNEPKKIGREPTRTEVNQLAEDLFVSQQPSVLPDADCTDGVCIQLVRSAGEYFKSQRKGVHRFTVFAIERDNPDSATGKDTLFAVVTGDGVSVTPAVNSDHFFGIDVGEGGVAGDAVGVKICWTPTFCIFTYEKSVAACLVSGDYIVKCVYNSENSE